MFALYHMDLNKGLLSQFQAELTVWTSLSRSAPHC